jgi:hypothetical protein
MKDKAFLQWIHDRLVSLYLVDYDYDFMSKFRAIIRATPDDQETPNTSG